MHLSYLTPSKRTYTLGILTVTAGMLLSCNTTPMTAMIEEGDSFRTQDMFHDGMVILESVPSGEGSIREVPGEVVIAGTADGSRTDACSDSISPSELASIERRVSLDAAESVWTDPVRANPRAAIQEERKSAATKIQSVARMYNSNAAARATIQEDLPHPDRGPQPDLIKLSAVGASAFALGGYVNQSFFNQQREEEAQTAREGATIRIRQLEEQLAAAEAAKRLQTAVDLYSQPAAEAEGLQTAVDFYNHTATLNNNTRCQLPDFFNQSCLLSAHPGWMKAAPLGMSAFLVGGYVAQKVRRSYNALHKQLETSRAAKQVVDNLLTQAEEKLTSEKEARVLVEQGRQEAEEKLTSEKEARVLVEKERQEAEEKLTSEKEARVLVEKERQEIQNQKQEAEAGKQASEEEKQAVQEQLNASITGREAVDNRLTQTQEQLAASRAWVATLIRENDPVGWPIHNVSVASGDNEEESIDHPGLSSMYNWPVHCFKKFGHWYANVNYRGKCARNVPVKSSVPLSLSGASLRMSRGNINYTSYSSVESCIGINIIYIYPPSENEASGR